MNNIFDQYLSKLRPVETRRIMICSVILTEHEILDALKHDFLIIHSKTYHTPKHQLKMCLLNNDFGVINLELEEIK